MKRNVIMRLSALLLASALMVGAGLPAGAAEPATGTVKVVASFSILADMVHEVGGDRVALTTLVGADGDAHAFEPSTRDAKALAEADVIVVNGLGFEAWIDRLIEASGSKARVVVASAGITPIAAASDHHGHGHHDHQDATAGEPVDPHAWQDLAHAKRYVANISRGLAAADPLGADHYAREVERYLAEIVVTEAEVRAQLATLPEGRRTVVTNHDAFGYFEKAYGITFLAPEGVSTQADPSAQDIAALIKQIREDKVSAVFVENISDARFAEQIERETAARLGGTLYSDALSGPNGPAATYLDMIRHNVRMLTAALSS